MNRLILLMVLCAASVGLMAQSQPSVAEIAAEVRTAQIERYIGNDGSSGGEQEARAKAIAQLQEIVAAHPEDTSERLRLAQMLSWNSATRPQALQVFDQGLQREPENVELLVSSAEVLSWSGATRPEAMARYDRALKLNPDEPRALNGKAQLLAWQGRTPDALRLYDQVLAKDPKNAAALRGKAEILNWRGRYTEARDLATTAHNVAPEDESAELELARANVGLQKFTAASQAISGVSGTRNPEFNEVRDEIHRGRGTYLDLGYAFREQPNQTSNNVEYHRFTTAISTPMGPSARVTFLYQPTLYDNQVHGFNSNYFGVGVDSVWSDRGSAHANFGSEVFNDQPVNFDGGAGFTYKLVPSTALKLNFQRQAVQESALSIEGQNIGPNFFGQVYSNLADVGISYSAHRFDVGVDYTDGIYTGRNLDNNRRYSVDMQAGVSLHNDKPYVRVGYYGNYTSFDHDADFGTGAPLNQTGGYFSPTRFLLNQGVLTVSHRFTKNVTWGMSGAAGVQNVETTTSVFSNAQFASSFESHLFWRVTPMNEIRLGYDYLNVFNAFQRNLFRFSWRHYF